jgi:hypothetical protein
MKAWHALLASVMVGFCAPVSAQNLKPGLWEMTHNVKSASGELERGRALAQQQMANMPPEQRRMMEEAMAKQGVQMGTGPGPMTMKTCLTKEMVERNEMPVQHGNCATTKQQRSGNTLKVVYTCTKPPSTTEGEYTFQSSEAFTVKMTVHTTVGAGGRDTMTVDGSGKWLSADCGKLKPVQLPPGKK